MSEEKNKAPKMVSCVTVTSCIVTMWSDCSLVVTLGDVDDGTFAFTPGSQMYFWLTNKQACALYDWECDVWNVEALRRWLFVQFQVELLNMMNLSAEG